MSNVCEVKPSIYSPDFEHDNCGIGAIVNIKGVKTHQVVENALRIVENLEHRAGKDAEGKTGDGVGILLQISHKFFSKAAKSLGINIGGEREYGVGMFFFPQDEFKRNQAKKMFEIITQKEGLELLGWREVPTNPDTELRPDEILKSGIIKLLSQPVHIDCESILIDKAVALPQPLHKTLPADHLAPVLHKR